MLALIAGPLLALALWDAYARYFARRTDISYAVALRWDVPSWAALVLLWMILAAPAGLSTQGRAIALAGGHVLRR